MGTEGFVSSPVHRRCSLETTVAAAGMDSYRHPAAKVTHSEGSSSGIEVVERRGWRAKLHTYTCAPATTAQKAICYTFWVFIVIIAIVLFATIFPRFVDRVMQPFIALLRRSLTPAQIGAVIFVAMVILPFTVVISVIPFVWVSGIVFDFWLALLIVMAGAAVGMSLQYWLARYIFHDRVVRYLERSPKRNGLAVTLRAVDLAGPWKVVALLRLGPFPYHVLNYVLGVAPNIKYYVYIICSVITEVLPRALQIFFGKNLETLADVFRGKVTNPGVAAYNIAVLAVGIIFVIFSIYYSKRTLRKLQEEELAKERIEADTTAAATDPEAAIQGSGSIPCLPDQIAAKDAIQAGVAAAVAAKERGALPDKVSGKLLQVDLARSTTGESSRSAAAGDLQGDLQILVDDASVSANSSSLARSTSSTSWIGVGRDVPPAAAAADASLSSAASSSWVSVSSTRALLGDRQASSSQLQ